MKVLFITSTFPRKEDDIQVPWMGELVRKLSSKGVKIEIFAPAFCGSPSHSYFGIDVYRFRYAPAFLEILTHGEGAIFKIRQKPWLFFISIFYLFFGLWAIIQKTRKVRYKIIHVHWPFPNGFFGVVAKWLTSARLIFTFYGAEFTLVNHLPLGNLCLRFLLRQADQNIAISNFTKKRIKEILDVPVEIIPFTSKIQAESFKGKIIRKKGSRRKRILFVGRLIERKGISFLFDAMPFVLESVSARLDVVGTGPLFFKLKKQIKMMNLQKKIFLHGRVSEEKLKDFYFNCDVFVLPAITDRWEDTEGLGVVLLEAMSFKKPVIASKVGGITDIVIDNKTGLLFTEKDSKAIARLVVKVVKNKQLAERLGREGYKYVQENFNWEKITQRLLEIYHGE